MAAILSLNGAKNNPKIVTKITAVRPKGGGGLTQAPPKYATERDYLEGRWSLIDFDYVNVT